MPYIANVDPDTRTTRENYDVTTIIQTETRKGVWALARLVDQMKRSGNYSQKELEESEEYVALKEDREKLAKVTKKIWEIVAKLREETKISEEIEGWNRRKKG